MDRLPFCFMLLAVIYVLIGMIFGIYIGANHEYALAPSHGHLNLIGFVMGSIFAFFYHLVPAARTRAGWVHFALHQLGVIVIFPGIVLANLGQTEELAKAGSVVTVLAMIVFCYVLISSRKNSAG